MKSIQKLIPLLIVALFTSLSLILMASGASAYKSAVNKATAADDRRTASRYIATRIHTAPSPGAVSIKPFGDTEALAIQDSDKFYTMVYVYDSWLMEACIVEDGLAGPADGTRLLPMNALSLSLDDDGTFTADGVMPDASTFHIESLLDNGGWTT